MNPSYANALLAAFDAVGHQDFPKSALFIVATPIGNLADITLRALHTLSVCDFLACEDTRQSKNLLRSYGIDKPSDCWIALHQHNEAETTPIIIEKLEQGARVAFLCDAGTPGIRDPGAWLVNRVTASGFRVVPIPGASSITTLLSASGLIGNTGFNFVGFLSTKVNERDKQIKSLTQDNKPTVILEAPHRIESLANSLVSLGSRTLTVGRELTKQFEQITTLPASEFANWLAQDTNRTRGEFVLIIHSPETESIISSAPYEEILRILLTELTLKGSVKLAQTLTGAPKNELYELALTLSKSSNANPS